MGATAGSSARKSSRHSLSGDNGDIGGINDINITPFVDVVLVLLVIFIVTAPMMMKDIVQLKLPKVTEADAQSLSTLAVVITKEGQVVVNGQLQTLEGLRIICLESLRKNPETQAILSADIDTRHGDVMKVIDTIKSSGIQQFAIQVEKSTL